MSRLPRVIALGVAMAVALCFAATAGAVVHMFVSHDHPNGSAAGPTYGFRWDDLIGSGIFTFSFDYVDPNTNEMAHVMMEYDDVAGTIHIFGRVFGGKDIGSDWDPALSGWADIEFTYTMNVTEADNCAGAPGNDLFVTAQDAANNGTLKLDGWGGDITLNFSDKSNGGCSFHFDNDEDPKGNGAIEADPTIYSASGWVMPDDGATRDWIFIAKMAMVPTEETSWGRIKSLYNE